MSLSRLLSPVQTPLDFPAPGSNTQMWTKKQKSVVVYQGCGRSGFLFRAVYITGAATGSERSDFMELFAWPHLARLTDSSQECFTKEAITLTTERQKVLQV